MAACETCWRDANGNPETYHRLLVSRACTPEEQAGVAASECRQCGRLTIHQHAEICMNPLCEETQEPEDDLTAAKRQRALEEEPCGKE